THESTRKLHRRIVNGTATVKSATVRRASGRWFVSFTLEVERAERRVTRPDAVIGADLGIRGPLLVSSRNRLSRIRSHGSLRCDWQ
ncbi:hypothetical protein ACFYYV_44905, partial [Streptomyces sp. NPDC001978]